MEQFFDKIPFGVIEKIIYVLVACIVVSYIIIKFAVHILIGQYDEIKASIKELYDRTDNYQEVGKCVEYCLHKNLKKK